LSKKNVNPDTSQAVRLDHRICGTRDDQADAARTLDRLLQSDFSEDQIHSTGLHRHWQN
jgi:hypothetical protein